MLQTDMAKIDKRLKWITPYVELTPAWLVKPYAIRIVGADPRTIQHGSIELLGRRVTIRLTLGNTAEYILHTLAHEMAHLRHWEHGPDHLELTGELFAIYTRHAFKLGLPDLS